MIRPTAERFEGLVLVVILLTVAGFAGAASFTHVHDWTMRHSPAGTGDWFGWANAVISELVPVACALVIRRRRRNAESIGYPVGLLLAAVCLSLAAQVAVAVPGPSGWLLSAVPALALMGLAKLVLSTPPAAADPVPVAQAVTNPGPSAPVAVPPPAPTVPATPLPSMPARANGTVLVSGVVR